jgi:hypothetical protein
MVTRLSKTTYPLWLVVPSRTRTNAVDGDESDGTKGGSVKKIEHGTTTKRSKDARWLDDAPSSCLPFDCDPYVANVLLVTNSGRLSHQLLSVVSEIGVRSVKR